MLKKMRLYSFSEIIDQQLTPVSTVINCAKKYYAHIDGTKPIETLVEHIELVLEYSRKIVIKQKIEGVLDNLCFTVTSGKVELANYIKLLFIGAIAYHDLGKINPNFQVEKMRNKQFEKMPLSIGSQHSILSSFIFLHFFGQEINNNRLFSKDSKTLLFALIHLFCYPITKHHSSTLGNENSFSSDLFKELFHFLQSCSVSLPEVASQNLFAASEKWIRQLDQSKSFALFALLKLNFSLLTASDYYATNEFMADIKVDEFGLIDGNLRTKIRQNFKTYQPFNKDLFLRFEEYQDKPFEELQEKSKSNLNYLRQKLNAEVISTLRNNPNNPWYYIEAPTGAGKTNLSLACISELLQTDESLNKVFYVFPFTTLITQTFAGIQKSIGLDKNEMIQLHSKAGFHTREEIIDGEYGKEKKLHLDNLFVNYPICVTSHIRFFDILKGNQKESNYLLHRLCNSIVVIDELQTYNPKHWDKILFFIENYARLFNMRFIIMSATLPKIDVLSETAKGKFVNLTPNKKHYFTNNNFSGRIKFDFSLLDKNKPERANKEDYLKELSLILKNEADEYYAKYKHSRVLIEFITKNTASHFFRLLNESDHFIDFKILLLSGDILENRRKEIINDIKNEGNYLATPSVTKLYPSKV
jgi:CRISPR-associated endonuclease/helicase Cas3